MEDEAEFASPPIGTGPVAESCGVLPTEPVLPSGRAVEKADDIEEGALSRPRCPHDADHLAGVDIKIQPPEGANLSPAESERALNPAQVNQWLGGQRGQALWIAWPWASSNASRTASDIVGWA